MTWNYTVVLDLLWYVTNIAYSRVNYATVLPIVTNKFNLKYAEQRLLFLH